MKKNLCLIPLFLLLNACHHKDERYYWNHPQALQQVLQACPNQKPQGLSCQALQDLAKTMQTLAYELQSGPQQFGKSILVLQQEINQLAKEPKPEKNIQLEQKRRQLAQRLSVVKWLESPGS